MPHNIIISIGLILTVIVSTFSGFQLIFRKEVRNATYKKYKYTCYSLAIACFVIALGNAAPFLDENVQSPLTVCNILPTIIALIQSALLTVSLHTLYSNKCIINWKSSPHLIPIVAFPIAYFISILFVDDIQVSEIDLFVKNMFHNPPSFIRGLFAIVYLVQLHNFYITLKKERKEYLNIVEQVAESSPEEIRLDWIKIALYSALSEGLVAAAIIVYPCMVTVILFLCMTIIFYFTYPIYYIRFSHTYDKVKGLLEVDETNKENKDKPKTCFLNAPFQIQDGLEEMLIRLRDQNNALFKKIEDYMQKEMAYLNSNFKSENLVTELATNRIYLANAIRQNRRQTIAEYILSHRLEYAKSLLRKEGNTMKIEEIAFASGFNSLRTFNRNFKDIIGETPEDYRRNNT